MSNKRRLRRDTSRAGELAAKVVEGMPGMPAALITAAFAIAAGPAALPVCGQMSTIVAQHSSSASVNTPHDGPERRVAELMAFSPLTVVTGAGEAAVVPIALGQVDPDRARAIQWWNELSRGRQA